MIRLARSHGSISRGRLLLSKRKPRLHPKMPTGSFVLSPLARLLALQRKRPGIGVVPAFVKFSRRNSLAFPWRFFGGNDEASFCCSTPERMPAGSIYRVGQGRLVILFALAFELLLGFPESRDARCDFGAVERGPFFLLAPS